MWEIVRAGGPLMWPIIACSIVALGIVVERLWTLRTSRVLPPDRLQRVRQLVEADQITDKVVEALERDSPLGRVLAAGLANRHRARDVVVQRVEDVGRHVIFELERFLPALGTIASIAPLLGLLGTVTGIINAFNAINAGGIGDPRALSAGISEALLTTAAGLLVAIPALIAWRFLRARVDRIVIDMEKSAFDLLDALEEAERRGGGAAGKSDGPSA